MGEGLGELTAVASAGMVHRMTIEQHRERLGMARTELARRLGTDDRVVFRWERCDRVPTADTRVAIARIFGVAPSEIDWDGRRA